MTESPNLDPADWDAVRRSGHKMLDDVIDYLRDIRVRPVWQPAPDEVRDSFRTILPEDPTDLAAVYQDYLERIVPFTAANTHPGFMGWVQGGGTAVGALAELLSAGLNANVGGRNQIPVAVEWQVVEWMRQLFRFPEGSSGLFVTGTSMAMVLAVRVALVHACGEAVRRTGLRGTGQRLVAYACVTAHHSAAQALELCGLGSDALRLIPENGSFEMDLDALQRAIERDRADGFDPFLIIGTAGSVDTGAIDNLTGLAGICTRAQMWFHVDGAFGALGLLAPEIAPLLAGIEQADSVAFDFHKWGQVPYDAGFVLIRDGQLHRSAFSIDAAYLARDERALNGGSPWPVDFGVDLSRGFRALKTWMTVRVYGTRRLGQMIARTCRLAAALRDRILSEPELELLAPVPLNIVCFRFRAEPSVVERVNGEIVTRVQLGGTVAPSSTRVAGKFAIRAAIVNHRTEMQDVEHLVHECTRLGRIIQSELRR